AVDVAKILDEAFNGVKATTQPQLPFSGNPFFNQFRGQAVAPPPTPSTTAVRVVADPTTNSLLVKASPLDMLRVRRLLESIDVDANGNPRGVDLSVGIDDTSNRLIVSCSDKMFKEIQTLVAQLDMAAKDTTRTVRVVSFKGDPMLAQQAIDAIMGRRPVQPNNMMNMGRAGFFPGGPGFGGGGFGGQGGQGMGGFR